MRHTKHQGSRPSGFRQDFFNVFPILAYLNHMTPRQSYFRPMDHNLNKLAEDRKLMLHTKYQGAMPCLRRFSKFSKTSKNLVDLT